MNVDTVMLLPGLDGTGTLFGDLVSEFPLTIGVAIASYPQDQFLSYSELFSYVMGTLPRKPFVLVAESFSTPLAVSIAATRPPSLVGLAMSAGFVTNPLGKCSRLARVLARPLLCRLMLRTPILKYLLIGADPPPALEVSVRRALRIVSPAVLAQRVRAVLNCDERESLARTVVPILYLQPKEDHLVRHRAVSEIRRLRPDITLTSVPGPHLLFQKQPRRCAALIMHFINQLNQSLGHS